MKDLHRSDNLEEIDGGAEVETGSGGDRLRILGRKFLAVGEISAIGGIQINQHRNALLKLDSAVLTADTGSSIREADRAVVFSADVHPLRGEGIYLPLQWAGDALDEQLGRDWNRDHGIVADRTSNRSGITALGGGAVFIDAGLAVLSHPNDEHDRADKRDENQQIPKPASSHIVQTPPRHRKGRDENNQRVEGGESGYSDEEAYVRENEGCHKIHEHKIPEFATAGTAVKNGVFMKDRLNCLRKSHIEVPFFR